MVVVVLGWMVIDESVYEEGEGEGEGDERKGPAGIRRQGSLHFQELAQDGYKRWQATNDRVDSWTLMTLASPLAPKVIGHPYLVRNGETLEIQTPLVPSITVFTL